MQLDIEALYPSISKELLLKASTYAKTLVNISDEEIDSIMYSKKSYIFNNTDVWLKKKRKPDIDIRKKSFDDAELYELVDLYILHILGKKYRKYRTGLYCVDGLCCLEYTSRQKSLTFKQQCIE